jgi:hypothetical protein
MWIFIYCVSIHISQNDSIHFLRTQLNKFYSDFLFFLSFLFENNFIQMTESGQSLWVGNMIRKTKHLCSQTVFVALSILLHVSAYIGHLQVLCIQNVKRTAVCNTNGSVTITY